MKIDLERFQALVKEGWLSCEQHENADLQIWNYTQKCQFAGYWTPETRMARGLITDSRGNIKARPFQKFMNYGQEFPWPGARLIEATEKMDGSLGVLYWVGNEPCISTRGAFKSDQAQWATNWFQFRVDPSDLDSTFTLLFEIIYPDNRIVVDYGDLKTLVLIGAVEIETGRDLLYPELKVIADRLGFSQPHVYQLGDVNDYLNAAKALSANEEGWVLRYCDGSRFKIKGEAYKIAHKLMTGISFNRVLEAVANGTLDGWIEGVPDEFLKTIREYEAQIKQVVADTSERVQGAFAQAPRGNRKEFALWVRARFPEDQGYLFALLDGKDILPLIYRHAFTNRGAE
jgi:RNA ligase